MPDFKLVESRGESPNALALETLQDSMKQEAQVALATESMSRHNDSRIF